MSRVTDATARIRRRRRSSWLRRALRWTVVGVVVLALAGLVWLVGFSSVLAVRQISVTGTKVLDAEEVAATAAVTIGTPLARLDSAAIAARVAGLAAVRDVKVDREWPGTVRIRVTERTAVYAVKQNQGTGYLLVDAQGVAFTEQASAPKGLLVATATSGELLGDLATVVAALPADLRGEVSRISAESRDDIQLTLSRSRTAMWGSADRSDYKATVLAALLKRKGTVYDVSAPDWPAVR